MSKALRVGVIGLGRMGRVHAANLAALPEVELVVASRRGDVAEEVGTRLGARWVHGYQAAFEADLDAVVIATATNEHVDQIIEAARRGYAIFTEKPIALDLESTDRALEAVEEAGVPFMVGFMRRFDPPYVRAKQLIAEGVIGRPVTFKAVSRDPRWPAHEDDHPSASGGFFMDIGVHDYDLARWLMGSEVRQVHAIGGALVYPELAAMGDIDNGLVNLVFENGALGNIEMSRNARYGYDIRTEVLGDEGALWIGSPQQTPLKVLTPSGVTHDVYPWYPERFEEAYRREMMAFVAGVLAGRPLSPSGEDGRRAVEIALAVGQSYRTGQPVLVAQTSGGAAAVGHDTCQTG